MVRVREQQRERAQVLVQVQVQQREQVRVGPKRTLLSLSSCSMWSRWRDPCVQSSLQEVLPQLQQQQQQVLVQEQVLVRSFLQAFPMSFLQLQCYSNRPFHHLSSFLPRMRAWQQQRELVPVHFLQLQQLLLV